MVDVCGRALVDELGRAVCGGIVPAQHVERQFGVVAGVEEDQAAAPAVTQFATHLVAADDVLSDERIDDADEQAAAVIPDRDVVVDRVALDQGRLGEHRDAAAAAGIVPPDDIAGDGHVLSIADVDTAAEVVVGRRIGAADVVALDDIVDDGR